jgi:hypothetical protein
VITLPVKQFDCFIYYPLIFLWTGFNCHRGGLDELVLTFADIAINASMYHLYLLHLYFFSLFQSTSSVAGVAVDAANGSYHPFPSHFGHSLGKVALMDYLSPSRTFIAVRIHPSLWVWCRIPISQQVVSTILIIKTMLCSPSLIVISHSQTVITQ